LIQVLVSECDDFQYCDVTSMTSDSSDVIDGVTDWRPVGTFIYWTQTPYIIYR